MKMIQSKARAEAFLQGLMAAKANFFFKIKSPSFNYFLFWSPAFNKGPFILSSVTKCFFVFVLLCYKSLAYFSISNLFGQSKIKPTSCRLRLFLTAFFNLCDESFYKTASASASASASQQKRRRRQRRRR